MSKESREYDQEISIRKQGEMGDPHQLLKEMHCFSDRKFALDVSAVLVFIWNIDDRTRPLMPPRGSNLRAFAELATDTSVNIRPSAAKNRLQNGVIVNKSETEFGINILCNPVQCRSLISYALLSREQCRENFCPGQAFAVVIHAVENFLKNFPIFLRDLVRRNLELPNSPRNLIRFINIIDRIWMLREPAQHTSQVEDHREWDERSFSFLRCRHEYLLTKIVGQSEPLIRPASWMKCIG